MSFLSLLKFSNHNGLNNFSTAPSFKICRKDSPDISKCIKDSVEFLRPKLKTGDFGNGFIVDPLEPIKIDDIIINRGDGFYVNLSNLKAIGASNFKLNKLRVSVSPFKIEALIEVPAIEAYGEYKLQMALGVLNLKGEGQMRAYLGNFCFVLLKFNK